MTQPKLPQLEDAALSLNAVVPGAREWKQTPKGDSGVFEIPVWLAPEPAADAAASSPARSAIEAVLARTPLFSALQERHLRRLIEKVRLVRLDADELLFQQGDPADALFVVASGKLVVLVRSEADASMVEVSRLSEGSFFGEIALLAEQPRSATLRAAVPCELLAIDREVVSELMRDSPEFLGVLVRFVRDRLLNSLIESNKLFARLSVRERLNLTARLRLCEVERGAKLLEEGKSSIGFFILQAGNLVLSRGGERIRALRPGDLFGAQPLLGKAPSGCTVHAETRSFLLGLNPAELADLGAAHPRVLESIRALSAEVEPARGTARAAERGEGQGSADEGAVKPGALSQLLRELAAAEPTEGVVEHWQSRLRQGDVVGRFELLRELGRGGFGVVYEARDLRLRRSVAFKAVRIGARVQSRKEQLVREAEAAAQLAHPNIVTLFDLGTCEHGPYLVFELLRGQTLAEKLGHDRIGAREAIEVAVEIARALAHAHGRGVIHRDLSPRNVFLCDEERVKVLDFGIAHVFGQPWVQAGTPAYMAPEQRAGGSEDERTDVFALGVILYQMVSGALPEHAGALEIPEAPALAELIRQMVQADPAKRPRDGAQVLAALAELQQAIEPPARQSR